MSSVKPLVFLFSFSISCIFHVRTSLFFLPQTSVFLTKWIYRCFLPNHLSRRPSRSPFTPEHEKLSNLCLSDNEPVELLPLKASSPRRRRHVSPPLVFPFVATPSQSDLAGRRCCRALLHFNYVTFVSHPSQSRPVDVCVRRGVGRNVKYMKS